MQGRRTIDKVNQVTEVMAGAFTHYILCDEARSRKRAVGVELWQLLNKYYPFLSLGAASPDLPYLSFRRARSTGPM